MRPRYQAQHTSVWDIEPSPWCVVEHASYGARVAMYCQTIEDASMSRPHTSARRPGRLEHVATCRSTTIAGPRGVLP